MKNLIMQNLYELVLKVKSPAGQRDRKLLRQKKIIKLLRCENLMINSLKQQKNGFLWGRNRGRSKRKKKKKKWDYIVAGCRGPGDGDMG